MILANIGSLKYFFKTKAKKSTLLVIVVFIITAVFLQGRILSTLSDTGTLNSRLIGIYAVSDKLSQAGFWGLGLDSSVNVGLETNLHLNIFKMNSLHSAFFTIIIQTGYLTAFSFLGYLILITWKNNINNFQINKSKKQLSISSYDFINFGSFIYLYPISFLFVAPLSPAIFDILAIFYIIFFIANPDKCILDALYKKELIK